MPNFFRVALLSALLAAGSPATAEAPLSAAAAELFVIILVSAAQSDSPEPVTKFAEAAEWQELSAAKARMMEAKRMFAGQFRSHTFIVADGLVPRVFSIAFRGEFSPALFVGGLLTAVRPVEVAHENSLGHRSEIYALCDSAEPVGKLVLTFRPGVDSGSASAAFIPIEGPKGEPEAKRLTAKCS